MPRCWTVQQQNGTNFRLAYEGQTVEAMVAAELSAGAGLYKLFLDHKEVWVRKSPTLDEAYEILEGLPHVLDGISGTIHILRRNGMTEMEHRPSPEGRRSEAYLKVKAELGDDWDTTLENCGEAMQELFAIAEKLYNVGLPLVG